MSYKPKKAKAPIVISPKKEFVFKPLVARTENQKNYIRLIKQKDVVICLGCAGTGKTTCAVGVALEYIYGGSYDKIVLTRPTIPACQESLGFLPGSFEDKINPFLRPIWDVVDDMLPVDEARIFKHDRVEICPLAFMRGRSLKNTIIICDEMQNASFEQLELLLTRLGENSKIVLTADLSQSDLPKNVQGGLSKVVDIIYNDSDFGLIELQKSDICRHRLVGRFLDLKEKYYTNANI